MFYKKNWDSLVNKVSQRLNSWKQKTLSIGKRITLIKSVIGSLPIYYMYLYHSTLILINSLERVRRTICWGFRMKNQRYVGLIVIKCWLQKKMDVVVLVQSRLINKAMLCTWVWRFQNDKIIFIGKMCRWFTPLHHNRSSNPDPLVGKSSLGPWKHSMKNWEELHSLRPNINNWVNNSIGFKTRSTRKEIENLILLYEPTTFKWSNLVPAKVNIFCGDLLWIAFPRSMLLCHVISF